MQINASHTFDDRGLDAYFTPREAVVSLIGLESTALPRLIREPATGDGAIVRPFRDAGYTVVATDIADYGFLLDEQGDYLTIKMHAPVEAVVTNPPYRLALPFIEKALTEVSYVAMLLRTNFLESTTRLPFFRRTPPARIWISSRRLPMMHRHGWTGPTAPSNTCYAWFIWDKNSRDQSRVDWFDWQAFATEGLDDFSL